MSKKPEKPYGFIITIRMRDGSTEQIHRVTSSRGRAKTLGLHRANAVEVEKLEPLTEEEYVRAFGRGRM